MVGPEFSLNGIATIDLKTFGEKALIEEVIPGLDRAIDRFFK